MLLLASALVICLFLVPLGLPGTWLMVGIAMLYNGSVGTERISWFTIGGTLVLVVGAEIVEFMLAGRYARKYGGSRRAGWGAILGGMVGAVMGFPVPIIGPMLGAFAGAFVGALVAEKTRGSSAGTATRVATGALIGKVTAVAAKSAAGCVIVAWILLDAWH